MKHCCKSIIAILVFFSSCKKDPSIPQDCIQSAIARISVNAETGTDVKEYTFQQKSVWVFNELQGQRDGLIPVLNSQCDTLGLLGGIGNIQKIQGEDFSNAVFVRTVYSK